MREDIHIMKLEFKNPIMIFAKCSCLNQVPIHTVEVSNTATDKEFVKYHLKCTVCGSSIHESFIISSKEIDLTDRINVFKVIPSIKDELAIIKLDTIKCKLKNNKPFFYGEYAHLRFWDRVIQKDLIKIPYSIIE